MANTDLDLAISFLEKDSKHGGSSNVVMHVRPDLLLSQIEARIDTYENHIKWLKEKIAEYKEIIEHPNENSYRIGGLGIRKFELSLARFIEELRLENEKSSEIAKLRQFYQAILQKILEG